MKKLFVLGKTYEEMEMRIAKLEKIIEQKDERIHELDVDERVKEKDEKIKDMNFEMQILKNDLNYKDKEISRLLNIRDEIHAEYEKNLDIMRDLNEKEVRATIQEMQNKELIELREELAKVRVEKELTQSKLTHYKGLFDSGKVGMDYSDLKGMLLAANPSGGAAFKQLMSSNKE